MTQVKEQSGQIKSIEQYKLASPAVKKASSSMH